MKHGAEDRTPAKISKDGKAMEAEGLETAPTKPPKRIRGAKKHAKVPQHGKDANKKDDACKDQDHRRKGTTLRRRSSKNQGTAGEQGHVAIESTEHKTPHAAEAPTSDVAVVLGATSNQEPAASATVATSDESGAPANLDQIAASHGVDETTIPPGDAVVNTAVASGGPAQPAGHETDYTRVRCSADTQAAPAGGSSDTLASDVPTQVATGSGSDQDAAARVIETEARHNQEAQAGKAVALDADAASMCGRPLKAPGMSRLPRDEEVSTKIAESQNLQSAPQLAMACSSTNAHARAEEGSLAEASTMEHEGEDRTLPKTSKDRKTTEAEGLETAPTKLPKPIRGAKKEAKVPQHDRDANKEDDVSKGQDHRRKSTTLRRRDSFKNRDTVGEQGHAATGSSEHKTLSAAEAPTSDVEVVPGATSSQEPVASAAVATSDQSRATANLDQIAASHGVDGTTIPPGDAGASAAHAASGGPVQPAGHETDYTRVKSSSSTRAGPTGGSSDTIATGVPTQVATGSGCDQDASTRVIGTKARINQESQAGKAVAPDADAASRRRRPSKAPWMSRMPRAEEASTKMAESQNLTPPVAERIPATWYAAIIIGSLASLTLVVYLLSRTGSKKLQNDTCKTLACAQFSKRLLESINRSANPCDSFDRYVCDGWRSGHDLSVHEDAFQSILGRLYSKVRDIYVPKKGQNAFQRAAAFYRSCECVRKGDCNKHRTSDELSDAQELLADAGVIWPRRAQNPDVLHTLLITSVQLRWGAILAFDFSKVAGERQVFLRMAEELNLLKWKSDEQLHSPDSRQRYFETLRDHFAPTTDNSSATSGTDTFVTYEEMQWLESTMLRHFFHMAPAKVTEKIPDQTMYNTVPSLTKQRWRDNLRLYFDLLNVTGRIVFRTNALDLVLQLLTQWRDHGEQAIHLMLSWCAVQMAALFANQKLIVNFYGSKGKADVAHGVSCFSKAFRIVGDEALFGSSKQFLPRKMRSAAASMTLGVRTAFRRRLERWKFYNDSVTVVQDWNSTTVALKYFTGASNQSVQSDGDIRQHLSEEDLDMGDSLVYNWYLAVRLSFQEPTSLRLSEDIENLNMYTLVQSGEQSPDFSLLPYAFAFPYFEEGATRALNYAGVASYMAEALSLLFLDAYDKEAKSAAALTQHFECMEGDVPDILGRTNWARRMEPVSLKVALDAYHSAGSAETAVADRRLEGLEFLSQEQLFFTAACFTRCAGSGTFSARRGQAHCDAAFRHVDEFATAFGCREGSPLNPATRCHIL